MWALPKIVTIFVNCNCYNESARLFYEVMYSTTTVFLWISLRTYWGFIPIRSTSQRLWTSSVHEIAPNLSWNMTVRIICSFPISPRSARKHTLLRTVSAWALNFTYGLNKEKEDCCPELQTKREQFSEMIVPGLERRIDWSLAQSESNQLSIVVLSLVRRSNMSLWILHLRYLMTYSIAVQCLRAGVS